MKYVIRHAPITAANPQDLPFQLTKDVVPHFLDADGVVDEINQRLRKCLQVIDFDIGDELHIEIAMKHSSG